MTDKVEDRTGWNYTIIENAIIDTDALNIYQKMFYISLKRFANIQTQEAFPGVKRVARMAGMGERKGRECIKDLEGLKLLAVKRRENNTSIYTLLPLPAGIQAPAPHAGGTAYHAGGTAPHAGGVLHTVHQGTAPHADELKKEELKRIELKKLNESMPGASAPDVPALPYSEIITFFNEQAGTAYKAGSKRTRQLIKARIDEGFNVADFKTVIEWKTREWSKNPKMAIYLRPETLFGTKFEGYLNERSVAHNGKARHNHSQGPELPPDLGF